MSYLAQIQNRSISLVNACVDLHMHCTGSSDVIPDNDLPELVTHLEHRLIHWTPTPAPFSPDFDLAVYAMIRAVTREARHLLATRSQQQRIDQSKYRYDTAHSA